jgi:hypothetical protein
LASNESVEQNTTAPNPWIYCDCSLDQHLRRTIWMGIVFRRQVLWCREWTR